VGTLSVAAAVVAAGGRHGGGPGLGATDGTAVVTTESPIPWPTVPLPNYG
jgi:hypothetical protein